MKETQTCETGFRWEFRKCIDCGKVFIAKNARSVRCLDCRAIHNKEMRRKYSRKYYAEVRKLPEPIKKPEPKPVKAETKKKVDDSNICKKTKSCYYGGKMGAEYICDFLSKTGSKRPCKAGECYFYKRKRKGT